MPVSVTIAAVGLTDSGFQNAGPRAPISKGPIHFPGYVACTLSNTLSSGIAASPSPRYLRAFSTAKPKRLWIALDLIGKPVVVMTGGIQQ